MIKLIVLLGNPGMEYAQTRHNIAWTLADYMLQNVTWQKKFKGTWTEARVGTEKRIILKPGTYMNKSGESVQALLAFYKWRSEEMLVIHDELELDFGTVGFRQGGGNAGHNGLRSLTQMLKSPDFFRFRIGISRPAHGDAAGYVLGKFNPEERALLPQLLKGAAETLTSSLCQTAQESEQLFKKHRLLPPP